MYKRQVMEYPTKELWIAGDHDANVALTHDFKTPNEAYAADSLPGTGFEDDKKMVDFQASYTTNANNTANLNSVDYTTSVSYTHLSCEVTYKGIVNYICRCGEFFFYRKVWGKIF